MSVKDLSISEMQQMQQDLQEAHKSEWGECSPKDVKNHILYMVEEIGECISIIKKKGISEIMDNPEVRGRFLEEITDVQNYYIEVLNRLEITPEEFSNAYIQKHNSNMTRNYARDNSSKYNERTFK